MTDGKIGSELVPILMEEDKANSVDVVAHEAQFSHTTEVVQVVNELSPYVIVDLISTGHWIKGGGPKDSSSIPGLVDGVGDDQGSSCG